jgi:hypothetical protein
MGLSRKKFMREFKLAAIQRLKMGASATEVARAFAVHPNVLNRWWREFHLRPRRPLGRTGAQVSALGVGGHLELYKSTKSYDGAVGREQHGYPPAEKLPL